MKYNLRPEIEKLVKKSNSTESIEDLLDINLKLAGYVYYIAEAEVTAHKGYLEAYNARKKEVARITLTETGTQKERECKAELDSEEFRQIETKFESLHNEYRLLRLFVQDYTQVLSQKISHLKNKYQNEQVR